MVEQFRWLMGSAFAVFFAGGLFDQVALPSVAAGVEATGRVRNTPWARAIRSAASEQLIFIGGGQERGAEAGRLRSLHRDVKGLGYNGVHYSALNPESWNWVLISTFTMHRNAFEPLIGRRLSAEDDQAIWDYYRHTTDELQLPGRSRLPETYAEVREYYDHIVAEKAEANITLAGAVRSLRRPPVPHGLPLVAKPLWLLLSPLAGEVLTVLGLGVLHPGIRALTPMTWTRRHDAEFAVLTRALRLANRRLPKRLALTPLAYNRWQYEQLVTRYREVGLTSFAASPAAAV